MTATLVRKLLRDLRLPLLVVALLLAGFQCLWAKVTQRVIGQLAPFFNTLAGFAGLSQSDIQDVLFEGPGRIARTLIGGDYLALDNAQDLLSIGYVHPLMLTIFCIWAVGRARPAAGALAAGVRPPVRGPDRDPGPVPEPVGRHLARHLADRPVPHRRDKIAEGAA
jgi:hypothetical protein